MLPKPGQARQDKVAKLRAAYEAGTISRAVYEFNMRQLGVEPEPEPRAPPEAPPDDRIEKVHDAYRAGRLSRELYERNIQSLGAEPLPVTEGPAANPSSPTPEAVRVTKAFEAAFEESRAAERVQAPDVAAVGGAYAPPPAVPSTEAKAAKVREAYEAGRISREMYETNLRALGLTEPVNPPPATVSIVPAAEPEVVTSAPVANPPPPPPPPASAPADLEQRVERLSQMFREGKMAREIYEANLAKAYEAVEPRLTQLRVAFEAGRIPKDVYDVNVRRLLSGRGVP